jgi:predicted HicB family RNase H-like nuclease
VERVAVLNVRIPDDLHHRCKVQAVIAGISLKDYVIAALAAAVEADEKASKRGR